MGTLAERYDAWADRYGRWWGPVLAPTASRLIERLPTDGAPGAPRRVLDLGTGTGVLALAAVRRWPTAQVVGSTRPAACSGSPPGTRPWR